MTFYLLDTNTVSDFINHPGGIVPRRSEQIGEDAVAIIVAGELRFGAE